MIYVMAFFSVLAGLDKILNNRFGIGEKFDEGFKALGGLALTVVGIYSISPVIADLVTPVFYPLANLLRTDPSVFISSILAPDLGAYNTSIEIARTVEIGRYNGLILSSSLGSIISFTIPVAIGIISKEDFDVFAKGVIFGIMTIPIGMIIGGLLMNIHPMDILSSLIPVVVFSIIMSIGLMKKQKLMIKIFNGLGKVIISISTLGLILLIINFGFNIEVLENMIGLEDAATLILQIAIVLSGAFPMFHILSRLMHKQLRSLEARLELDQYSILGLFSTLAHCMPMLGIYDKMNEKGKILNAAFVVSAGFALGGQLGYVTTVSPESVNAFLAAKIIAGVLAVIIANGILKRENNRGILNEGK